MGARAEVNQVAALVGSDALIVRDLALDHLHLEGVGLEKLKCLVFGEDQAVEGLVSGGNLLGGILNGLVVLLVEDLITLTTIYLRLSPSRSRRRIQHQ